MHWLIKCRDKPDGGPLLDDDGVKTIGSVQILDVADKAEAEAFWAGEPFNRAGVYEWTIERWRFGHAGSNLSYDAQSAY